MNNTTSNLHALELLAPAKNADQGIMAVDHGADAVYIGGPSFGARKDAGNSLEDIARLAEYAHQYDARVFLALNTLFTDEELPLARRLAFEAADAGVDALIVQDMGLLAGELPDIELHASTQCDIRTPEKAAFLEAVGMSQLVVARELSLEEIAAVRSRLSHARIEAFVHGALCVSYSGRCYISEAVLNRSANRGACAQFCRLPYDVYANSGDLLFKRRHVLSLKDNDQSANLEAMIDAGVSSFKIEGRLKDSFYVKNVTAYYRRALDEIIARRPELRKTSDGRVSFSFEPDPEKTFQRGRTEYFAHGKDFSRAYDLAELGNPKSTGAFVGTVSSVRGRFVSIEAEPGVEFRNDDGITFFDSHDEVCGFSVNGVEDDVVRRGRRTLTLVLRDESAAAPLAALPGQGSGCRLYRNRDRAFQKLLEGKSADRRIPVSMKLSLDRGVLKLQAGDGARTVCVQTEGDFSAAKNQEKNLSSIKTNLSKLGETLFVLDELSMDEGWSAFVPASMMNAMRREAADALMKARRRELVDSKRSHRAPVDESACYPEKRLEFYGNAANSSAKAFYKAHGVEQIAPAFEIVPDPNGDLMTCRHCIRASLKLCPKYVKAFPEILKTTDKKLLKPEPLIIKTESGLEFEARFHCTRKPCEMTIVRRL